MLQYAFAAPDANYPHLLLIMTIHDAKWRMDEFPQHGLIELGHQPTHVGMIGQRLDALEDCLQQFLANLGYSLFRVLDAYVYKIAQRGVRETDGLPWHGITSDPAAFSPRPGKPRVLLPGLPVRRPRRA